MNSLTTIPQSIALTITPQGHPQRYRIENWNIRWWKKVEFFWTWHSDLGNVRSHWKLNNNSIYVNEQSDHPLAVVKRSLFKAVSQQTLSVVKFFQNSMKEYQSALGNNSLYNNYSMKVRIYPALPPQVGCDTRSIF